VAAADRALDRLDQLERWVAAHPRAPLVAALALAVLARVFLVAHTGAMLDGDEALVGIQAEHILRGERPTYFYAQPYMGSLEAYLVAGVFWLAGGPSPWALRAVPIALSLALVALTWRLAWALLPARGRATPLLAGLAALLAAAPPLYVAVAELRTWGGQIEMYVLSLALLLGTVRLRQRLRAGMRSGELAWRVAVLGLLVGLGLWVNPLIVYALVACAVWVPLPLALSPLRWRERMGRSLSQPLPHGGSGLAALAAGLGGLALGGLPVWLYAARHQAANLLVYVTQPEVSPAVSGAARHGRLFLGAAITARYATCVAPRVADGALPGEPGALLPVRLLLLVPPLVAMMGAGWLVFRRWRGHAGGAYVRVGLPLLYMGVITAIFGLGTAAWAATKSCALDLAGRYAVPLGLALPLVLLALLAVPSLWAALRGRRAPRLSALRLSALRRGRRLAVGALLVAGALQLALYPLASPTATFQSPYYDRVPARIEPLLAYLRAHEISAVWANHWLGNLLTFESAGHTISADYYDQVVQHGLARPPGSLATVMGAAKPSFVVMTAAAKPLRARELDARGVSYPLARPTPGVAVITPTRRVDPAQVVAGLGEDYAR
jgi:hypothetical protein